MVRVFPCIPLVFFLLAAGGTICAGPLLVGPDWEHPVLEEVGYQFADNETQIDLFAVHRGGVRHHWSDDTWGGGVRLTRIFARYFGVSLEGAVVDARGAFGEAATNLVFRIPIESWSLAPYVFSGGGMRWESAADWQTHLGGGLEYRFGRGVGVFGDGRYEWGGGDSWSVRTGVRFSF